MIKTQLQTTQRSRSVNNFRVYKTHHTISAFKAIISEYGVRGLYVGLIPRLSKVAPACAIMFATYEIAHAVIDEISLQELKKSQTYYKNLKI